jgi:tripartite ATP-independent transporter DctP family solute receptor
MFCAFGLAQPSDRVLSGQSPDLQLEDSALKFRCSVVAAALSAAMLALAPAMQAQATALRVYGTYIAQDPSSQAMLVFKTEAERWSGGTLEFEIIPNTLGGGAREIVDDLRTQNAFGIWIAASNMSRLVPEIGALSLPFVFDNFDQVARAVKGPAGAIIEEKLAAKGFTTLGWMEWGAQNVINSKRPLRTIDDFKGMKIRVLPNEAHLAIYRAIGANPMAIDVKDIFPALRQGDVDGQANTYSNMLDYKFYEYGKYVSDSAAVLDLSIFLANRKTFMSLSPKEQKAIREAAAIACGQEWKISAARDLGALATLQEKGLQFDPLPPETRVALRRATAVVIEDAKRRLGDKIVNGILAVAAPGAAKSSGH